MARRRAVALPRNGVQSADGIREDAMGARFVPCPTCSRHVKQGDCLCPFCGAKASCSDDPALAAKGRVSRAVLFAAGAVGAGLATTDCSSSDTGKHSGPLRSLRASGRGRRIERCAPVGRERLVGLRRLLRRRTIGRKPERRWKRGRTLRSLRASGRGKRRREQPTRRKAARQRERRGALWRVRASARCVNPFAFARVTRSGRACDGSTPPRAARSRKEGWEDRQPSCFTCSR